MEQPTLLGQAAPTFLRRTVIKHAQFQSLIAYPLFRSEKVKYIPAAMINSAIAKVKLGISRQIINDKLALMNGATE